MTMHRIFVYGTLKRGQYNNYFLENKDHMYGVAKFVGEARSVEQYPMVVASCANVPCLLPLPGKGQHVFGEIYDVDEICLAEMDRLEGHPDHYERGLIIVDLWPDTLSRHTCSTYFLKDFKPFLLDLPYIDTFASGAPPYCLEYIPSLDGVDGYPARKDVQRSPQD